MPEIPDRPETTLFALHRLVWTALMAALIAVGSFLSLPLGPVPFTMQPFFVLLTGLVLGPRHAFAALCVFVGSGLVGLPVFAGGKSGLAVLFGPTGGYLAGYLLAAPLIGLAARGRPGWLLGIVAGLAGLAVIYGLGVLNLMRVLGADLGRVLLVGFVPFILQDLVKLVLAVAVWRFMHRRGLLPGQAV